MKRSHFLCHAIVIMIVSLGLASQANALSAYGTAVDTHCAPETPFADQADGTPLSDCTLCHASDFGSGIFPNGGNVRADELVAWSTGNLDFFCAPAANAPPVLAPIGAKMTTEGMNLSFVISATDPENGALTFPTPVDLPAGASFVDNTDGTASFSWTPVQGEAGMVTVTFVVNDDQGASAMEAVTITIFNANRAPVLDAIGNQTVDEGGTLNFNVTGNDPDGDGLTLAVTNAPTSSGWSGGAFNGTQAFSWTPGFDESGNYSVTFTLTDSGNPMLTASETIVVTVGEVNRPPVLDPIGNQGVNEGDTLNLDLTSSDLDGDTLTISAANLPNGASFTPGANGTAAFSWTPGFGDTGNHTLTFTVTDDGTPAATDSETITIAVGDVNRPPVLAPIGNRNVDENQLLSFAISATDADGDAITLTPANLPMGATFDDAGNGSGTFSWTPGFDQGGNHSVSFTATDNGNPALSDTETIQISVGNVNRPPVLNPIGARMVDEGQLLQIAIMATDPDADALTIQAANAPAGSQLQDNGDGSATFAWTPAFGDAGNVDVTFSVTDAGNPMASDMETVTITVGDVNRPPVLAPIGNRAANTNQQVTFLVSGSDPDGNNVSVSLSGMPANATFTDNGDGTGTFDWTPAEGDVGNHMMTFTATDDGNPNLTDTETVTISVGLVNNPPTLVQIGNRTVVQGQTIQFAVLATDPDPGNSLSYTASGVPASASFVDNGDGTASFSWMPLPTQVGSVNVTITVTDDGIPAMTDSETVNIAIEGVASGFNVTVANWWETWGGTAEVAGFGAQPGATVEILDADSGTVLATVTADEGGNFETGECRVIKRKRKKNVVLMECTQPVQAPCAVQARSGASLSLRTPLANPGPSCGAASAGLLNGDGLVVIRGKRNRERWFQVAGDHVPANAQVEIRAAETDGLVSTVMSDANGRFSFMTYDEDVAPCYIRIGTQVGGADVFSEPSPVQILKRTGRRRTPARPMCSAMDTGSFPAPSAIGTASPEMRLRAVTDNRTFWVNGSLMPPMADLELRDAMTDQVIAMATSDGDGEVEWALGMPDPMVCHVRVAARANGMDHISESTQVMLLRKRAGKKNLRVPYPGCEADPELPDPVAPGGDDPDDDVQDPDDPDMPDDPDDPDMPDDPGDDPDMPDDPDDPDMPDDPDDPDTPVDPVDPAEQANIDAFNQTVYPIVRDTEHTCVGCHVEFGPGSPKFAHDDLTTAYRNIWDFQKVNLNQPLSSRVVQQLLGGHYCWDDCGENAEEMRAAIASWATLVGNNGGNNNQNAIASETQTLADGAEGAAVRVEDAVIAKWEFLEGTGNVAMDTSGVAPAMNLELSGTQWLGEGGIEILTGKAQAPADTARKLHDIIADDNAGTNEFTVEAFVTPTVIEQRGPARIVSYSRDTGVRNFTLGQDNYEYVSRVRSRAGGVSNNGTPGHYTSGMALQTEMQHVVMTSDQVNGRRIYVNGVWTGDEDSKGPGALTNWNASYPFILGNEATNNRLWRGKIHFVAIHSRALTPLEIAQNFEGGAGGRVILSFDVAQWTGIAGSTIELEVSEFDGFSYLFGKPTYRGPAGAGFAVKNIRIAVNGVVPVAGQAFRNLDVVVNEDGQQLSPLGSIIAKDQGPDADVFSLEFEMLGNNEAVVVDNGAPVTPGGFAPDDGPEVGIRNFDQINHSMAAITGVNTEVRQVRDTYRELTQQLPGSNDVMSFGSSHQVGIFKLAVEYCDEMMDVRDLREDFFGTQYNLNRRVVDSLTPQAKQHVTDTLIEKIYGANLANQPGSAEAGPEVLGLLDSLTAECEQSSPNDDDCQATRTRAVVKAACSAVLSSAPLVLH